MIKNAGTQLQIVIERWEDSDRFLRPRQHDSSSILVLRGREGDGSDVSLVKKAGTNVQTVINRLGGSNLFWLVQKHAGTQLQISLGGKEIQIVETSETSSRPWKLSSWCCYITVDSSTTALQKSACTYQCISKQMHYKTPFSHNGYMKVWNFMKNTSLCSIWKNKTFWNIILTHNHAWHITQSGLTT